jgi:hypothetical protein
MAALSVGGGDWRQLMDKGGGGVSSLSKKAIHGQTLFFNILFFPPELRI